MRELYIQAEEVEWDYAPLNGNACGPAFGFSPQALVPFEPGSNLFVAGNGTLSLGRKIKKAMFVEYLDAGYTTRAPRDPSEAYLGLLGPTLRANVGDTLVVNFKNKLSSSPASMHPHGVLYLKGSEGAPYRDGTSEVKDRGDDLVPPNQTWRYVWHVPERTGPGKSDLSSIMWMYHAHSEESMNAGLFGAIIVYPRPLNSSDLRVLNRPSDIDKEVVLFFSDLEESDSIFTESNIETLLSSEVNDRGLSVEEVASDSDFAALNLRPSINGFMFCNLPSLQLTSRKISRFHLMTLGAQLDMHAPSIDSASLYQLGQHRYSSSLQLSSGMMVTLNLKPQAQGTWRIFDGVQDHASAGMMATYGVIGADTSTIPPIPVNGSIERVFYIAAEVVEWDYSPGYEVTGAVMCTQANYTFRANTYLSQTPGETIGHRSLKARYVLYSDGSFANPVPQSQWRGIQGPMIVAEAGDVITIVFKNSLPSSDLPSSDLPSSDLGRSLNLRPLAPLLALLNSSSSSVTLVSDQGSEGFAPPAAPGETVTYRWLVPPEAGPPLDPIRKEYIELTAAYTYSSSLDPTGDENLGLVGALVIGCKGCLDWTKGQGVPRGMDRMEPLLFQMFDENISPFFQANTKNVNMSHWAGGLKDPDFMESNMRHTINGFMYCTGLSVHFALGERVRWILLGFGANNALHMPYFEGQMLQTQSGPSASTLMMPGQAAQADMTASRLGRFAMWCQVHDHLEAGMMASMLVS